MTQLYLNFTYNTEKMTQINELVQERLPEILAEALLKDENRLKALIKESVKGQISAAINDILQGKDYKHFLRDKILKELGAKE